MKKINNVIFTPIALTLAACSTIYPEQNASQQQLTEINLQQHEEFRGGHVEFADQKNWYRELRLADWRGMGLTDVDLQTVLPLINNEGALRDTIKVYGPGQWTYEWTQQADKIAQQANKAKSAELYRRASALYLVASYPNLLTEYQQKALANAVQYYILAGQSESKNIAMIDMPLQAGGAIPGLLHLPQTSSSKSNQLPVVLWTGGVDKTLVEHYHSVQKYMDDGFAVITFDIPGGGLNKGLRIEPRTETVAHDAALNYVRASSILNENRVAALSSSGGGVSLIEFTLANPSLKAVVARCAMVDGVLSAPEHLAHVPKMSVDSFFARLGVSFDEVQNPGDLTVPLSLKTKGYFDGKHRSDVPLLVINTKDDPIASPEDMQSTAGISSNSEVAYIGEAGHCPEGTEAEGKIYEFITARL